MNNVQVPLNLKLWRTSGCHELLASLGFDLIGVGKDEVMLSLIHIAADDRLAV